MKKTFTLIVLSIASFLIANAQYWSATGALSATGSSSYLIGATHAGGKIYVLSREQNIAYSENLGVSWTKPAITRPGGDFVAIAGIKDRLYASLQLNTYDHNLYYTTNNGVSWQIDNDGLPQSLTNTGKSAMILKYMGDDYVLAHNYQKAVYKKLNETTWQSTFIDFAIVDIASTTDKWLAIGAAKILQSTDKGKTWTTINTAGLPAGFQGSLITTNGSRIFVTNAPANGGEDVYFSDDGGLNWTKTNSAGKFNYANPWLKCIYAVENYVFSSVSPKFGDSQNAPPFIISSATQPSFSIGNITGLATGRTNTNLPFFFHVKNKLFTMFWDLYSSEPGFSGIPTGTRTLSSNENEISFYPNPAHNEIQINSKTPVKLMNANGSFIRTLNQQVEDISGLPPGLYILISENGMAKKLVKQ
jgi:photosystem II stability/assembly factor-like uncharacterized protein